MKRLRVGVVGVGHLGQHHARILASMPDVELVAVADARPEQAQTIADRFGTRAVRDYRAAPRPGRRRLDRRAHRPAPRGRRGLPRAGHPRAWSRSRWPARSPRPSSSSRCATPRGALLQVGHIERFNPALSALEQAADPPQVHHRRAALDLHVPLDRHRRRARPDDPRHRPRALAGPGPGAVGGGGGREPLRRARGRRQRADRVRGRHRRQPHGQPGQLTRPCGRCGSGAREGYASLDFAAKQATLVRPSDEFLRGELDLEGVDLEPARRPSRSTSSARSSASTRSRRPAASPWRWSSKTSSRPSRGAVAPRVSGDDALRAMRLADQVLSSLNAHRWDGEPAAAQVPSHPGEASSVLRGPHAWRIKSLRRAFDNPSTELSEH